MKHRVTVETKTKKHFLGIPYTATEKKHIMVDGKTWQKMKREQQEAENRKADEALACATIVLEEELVDIIGE